MEIKSPLEELSEAYSSNLDSLDDSWEQKIVDDTKNHKNVLKHKHE